MFLILFFPFILGFFLTCISRYTDAPYRLVTSVQLMVGSLGSEYKELHLGGDRNHICQNLKASARRCDSVSSVKAIVLVRADAAGLLCRHGSCCVGVGRVPTQAAPIGVGIQIWLARGHDLAVDRRQIGGTGFHHHWPTSPLLKDNKELKALKAHHTNPTAFRLCPPMPLAVFS